MSDNTSVLSSEATASQSLVPTVPKYDGAKQRDSELPLSSGMSMDLRGYLCSAPLLPLKVFRLVTSTLIELDGSYLHVKSPVL